MSTNQLRDQRGVAMVFELVLVALVLSFVGLAIWQANQHSKQAINTSNVKQAPAVTVVTVADSAVKLVQEDLVADAAISSASESAQESEFSAIATEANNLGGSFDDSDF